MRHVKCGKKEERKGGNKRERREGYRLDRACTRRRQIGRKKGQEDYK
jgi:hypothetical protein